MQEYWALEFQTDANGPDLLLVVSSLQAKLLKVRETVQAFDLSERAKNLYLSAIDQVMPFLSGFKIANLSLAHLQGIAQQIDILHLAAASISDQNVPAINDITIDTLVKELAELVSEISASNLPSYLKQLVVPQLETLMMAVRSYRLLGAEGVARVYGAAAAELWRISGFVRKEAPETKSLLAKTLGIAKKIGTAIVWAGGVVGAANGIIEDGSTLLGISDQSSSHATEASSIEKPD